MSYYQTPSMSVYKKDDLYPNKGPSWIEMISAAFGVSEEQIIKNVKAVNALIMGGLLPDNLLKNLQWECKNGNIKFALLMLITKGVKVGFDPIEAVGKLYIVNNRISLWGDAPRILIWRSEQAIRMDTEWEESTKTYWATVQRKGTSHAYRVGFSEEDAKAANLIKDESELTEKQLKAYHKSAWYRFKKRMQENRASWFAYRAHFPDILDGLESYEEQMDISTNTTQNISKIIKKEKEEEIEKQIDEQIVHALSDLRTLEVPIDNSLATAQSKFELGIEIKGEDDE